MLTVPDRISTLELSKLWLYKALQELEAETNQELPESEEQEDQEEQEDVES